MKNKTLLLVACIVGVILVGSLPSFFTMDSINGWYKTANKPSFNPPNYLFGPVWTILFTLMGIGLYLILQTPPSLQRKKAITIFGIQLFLNVIWSFLFFTFQQLGLALVEIIIMWIFILLTIIHFYKLNKTAALLQIPYILWVSFATILNASIWYLNK